MSSPPLEGVRVLDLTRILAGPFATMTLADLGAEVLKVERPGTGDDTRTWGPPFVEGVSTYFYAVNRGKRSVTLDLKTDEGKEVLRRLVASSDVVCENFRPGTLARLGFDWETLRSIREDIIYCSISGYGHRSANRDRPSYDLIVQGEAGLMDLTGDPDGTPTKAGISVADETAGMIAVQGILAALFRRERTGEGERVDIGLFDGVLSLLTYQAQMWLSAGEMPRRRGNRHPSITPYETFRAADGRHLNVGVGNDRLWGRFCEAVDRPGLADDPRFETNADRVRHRAELRSILDALFLERSADDWYDSLSAAGVPVGRIHDAGEALALAEEDEERGLIRQVEDPELGTVPMVGCPVRLDSLADRSSSPPPRLGEHTDAILTELGYGADAVDELRSARVI